MSRVRRNIMLPVELDTELESISKITGQNRSELVRRALSHYLDLIDLDIAAQRARRYESGETKALTPEQLRRALTK